MARLKIRSNMGTSERPNYREMVFEKPITERVLAGLLGCDTTDIRRAAMVGDVTPIYKPLGDGGGKGTKVLYDIDSVPILLRYLRDDRPWLSEVDLSNEQEIEINTPSGSTLTFFKN